MKIRYTLFSKRGFPYPWTAKVTIVTFLFVSIVYLSSYIVFSKKTVLKTNYQTRLIKSLDEVVQPTSGEEVKTILLWNSFFNSTDFDFGFGTEPFVKHCPVSNCYITNDREYMPVESFDSVVFHTPTFKPNDMSEFPKTRLQSQIYMMYNTESPSTHPPLPYVDDFINITATYRMDSDIFYPYFHIVDKEDNLIAPGLHPTWQTPGLEQGEIDDLLQIHRGKSKSVAWFVSNCNPSNNRMQYVQELKKYIDVDIYGACGNTTCDKEHEKECKEMLRKDYFFYLSFENSNCLEYVTEKLANAYNSDLIPVVMNGADMMQIGMPNSYLDVRDFASSRELAEKMQSLIENSSAYIEYFWWKKHYRVLQNISHVPFCELCRIMHEKTLKPRRHVNLIRWMKGTPVNPLCKNNLFL